MKNWQNRLVATTLQKYKFQDVNHPNFLISINRDVFERGVAERLRAGGKDIDKYLSSAPKYWKHPCTQMYHPVRWVLISLGLNRSLRLIPPTGVLSFRDDGKSRDLTPAGWVRRTDPIQTTSYHIVPYATAKGPLRAKELIRDAQVLEPYYRTIFWQIDRLSIALHSFWAFLFSPFMEQSYVSLVTILEGLLHEGKEEIAHQIAERTAVLLERDSKKRLEVYKAMKKLYGLRSQIAHGIVKPKKGQINWETSIVSASMSIISISQFKQMATYAVAILQSIIRNEEIRAVIQTGNNDSVNEFFLRQIFAGGAQKRKRPRAEP